LLSSARQPFCSFGHVWVVLALVAGWADGRPVDAVVDNTYSASGAGHSRRLLGDEALSAYHGTN
jgi:hypothetical protein